MQNWFEFKGISSNNFKNMLVLSLPPFKMPEKRYEIIYHNGVDGGVIKDTGYNVVQKNVTIGLTSADNIDEITAWLTDWGYVVFGNDPDKYCFAQIVDGIDFVREGRFYTAIIPFMCQPYKYLRNEPPVVITDMGTYTIYNNGNTTALPTIEIYDATYTETATFTVNGFNYQFIAEDEFNNYLRIDSELQNTYNAWGQVYNRAFIEGMNGYPKLQKGKNTIVLPDSEAVYFTKIVVTPRSRFI